VDLDSREMQGVEPGILRIWRWTSSDLEYSTEMITTVVSACQVPPGTGLRQGSVLRPHAQRKRKGPDLVARNRRVDRHLAARDLLLDDRIGVFPEVGMPESMIAELKPLAGEELELFVTPRGLLPFDPAVPEEGVARGRRRQ